MYFYDGKVLKLYLLNRFFFSQHRPANAHSVNVTC